MMRSLLIMSMGMFAACGTSSENETTGEMVETGEQPDPETVEEARKKARISPEGRKTRNVAATFARGLKEELDTLLGGGIVAKIDRGDDAGPEVFESISPAEFAAVFHGIEFRHGEVDTCTDGCCTFLRAEIHASYMAAVRRVCMDGDELKEIEVEQLAVDPPSLALKSGEKFRQMETQNPIVWLTPDGNQVSVGVVWAKKRKENEDNGEVRVSFDGKTQKVFDFTGDFGRISRMTMDVRPDSVIFTKSDYGKDGDGAKVAYSIVWDAEKKIVRIDQQWQGSYKEEAPLWTRGRDSDSSDDPDA